MDNITHSLAGLLLAGTAVQWRARRLRAEPDDASFATAAALTGIAGANLPDIDVLWSAALQAAGVYDDLLSLLHHRGYTHTVLAAVIGIPLLWVLSRVFRAWQQRDTITSSRERAADRQALLLLCIASVASHVTLDFTNDYGVHPFSPFVNAWYYGDTVFIIEPWLWVAAIPMLLRVTERRLGRVLLWMVLLLGIALSWAVPQVSREAAAVLSAGASLWLVLSQQVPRRWSPVLGIVAWLVVTSAFVAGTRAVRGDVIAAHAARRGVDAAILQDVVISPSPANPLCARVILVETTRDDYRLTTAWASAAPSITTAAWCSAAAHTDTTRGAQTLPMVRSTAADTPAFAIQWTWQAPRRELADLSRTNCRVSAWLRFVRVPFWVRLPNDSLRMGDLRYDRERRVSVAAMTVSAAPTPCPNGVPPWVRPRERVIQLNGAD